MYLYFAIVYFSAVYIESESHLQLSVVLVGVWPTCTWLVCGTGIDSQSMLVSVLPRLLSKLGSKPPSFSPKSAPDGHTFKSSSSCESVPGTT